ncbi:D-2-hydroxyacid dehydrogenase [Mangrovibacterium marinum]|uniref:Glycerate dehydrogenase n=1 Tax=Mangrovibacterium marinum TaxID=1639118 RepID=A0A2T5C3L4_9BACT|nr:D-2-hydroxyacid dehydrogenase [Mangrovibacterium marinum]PTN09347.1 glycerate dehydrogenase [Mangrovibacterium marinum]
MKLVVLDGYTLNPGDLSWKPLECFGELVIFDRTKPEELLSRIKGASAIFTNKVIIDDSVIRHSPTLKYIGVMATGYNVVDLQAANRAGITVTNIPAYSTNSVAQLVFSFILHFANQLHRHAADVADGGWTNSPDFSYTLSPQQELAGKVIGIVGFGQIGQKVAQIAQAFGMRVIFQNRSDKSHLNHDWQQVELDDLLTQADYVSLNCPLTAENHGFMNLEKLLRMKKGAVLINTARGALVDEQALAEVLNTGRLAGAGLDVLTHEPPEANNPLPTTRNCIITPHIAWATQSARKRLLHILTSNFEAYLNHKPQNVVNHPFY